MCCVLLLLFPPRNSNSSLRTTSEVTCLNGASPECPEQHLAAHTLDACSRFVDNLAATIFVSRFGFGGGRDFLSDSHGCFKIEQAAGGGTLIMRRGNCQGDSTLPSLRPHPFYSLLFQGRRYLCEHRASSWAECPLPSRHAIFFLSIK